MNLYMVKNQTSPIRKKIKTFFSKIKKSHIVDDIIESLYHAQLIVIYILVAFANVMLLIKILSPDESFDSVIPYVEKTAILIATIAILTFTYSMTLEYPKKKQVVKSGEYFLKSFLNYTIGAIFIIGLNGGLVNPSNYFDLPDQVFNFHLVALSIFYICGVAMLISSAYFFAVGINDLLKATR